MRKIHKYSCNSPKGHTEDRAIAHNVVQMAFKCSVQRAMECGLMHSLGPPRKVGNFPLSGDICILTKMIYVPTVPSKIAPNLPNCEIA